MSACCFDCQRSYGDEFGFPDLIIPYWAWKKISPTDDDGGLLCPSCICKRLHDAGIRCEGAFMSGPIIAVSEHSMELNRRLENIELAIEGRNNHWQRIRELIDHAGGDDPNAEHVIETTSKRSEQPPKPGRCTETRHIYDTANGRIVSDVCRCGLRDRRKKMMR